MLRPSAHSFDADDFALLVPEIDVGAAAKEEAAEESGGCAC